MANIMNIVYVSIYASHITLYVEQARVYIHPPLGFHHISSSSDDGMMASQSLTCMSELKKYKGSLGAQACSSSLPCMGAKIYNAI